MNTIRESGWPQGLRSLQHRDFRLLWGGLLISAVGTWMQIVAQSLLVLRITHGSAFALGVVSLAQATAFFVFALAGGGFADRLDRRRLLLTTQSVLLCLALLMGLLTLTGAIRVWMIVAIAFLSGTALSFDQPARAALISSVVPQKDLLNAISLQSAVFNGASTLGPALAGITIQAAGLAANFFFNAASFVPVLVSLMLVRSIKLSTPPGRPKLIAQVADVLLSVKRDLILPWLLLSYGILLFAAPSLPLLLPVMAVNILHIDARTLGILFSAAGIGAVAGAVTLASLPETVSKRLLLYTALTAWILSLTVVGVSRAPALTFIALLGFGGAQSVIGALTATLLQVRLPSEKRGRIMSLNTLLVMGVRPLGDFPAGALISIWGAPITAAASAILAGTVSLFFLSRAAFSRAESIVG